MRRFRFEQDRDSYCAAHALASFALASVEPNGRPEILSKCGIPQLRFNIWHTRRVVASIVPGNLDCGVNIELIHRCSDLHDLVRTVLAPVELATIAVGPDTERLMLFCRYWTRKEAYAKALGLGMSLAFDCMVFELYEGSPHLLTHSDEWHSQQRSPTTTYTLSKAVRALGSVRIVRHCGMLHNITKILLQTRPI
jgi:phosphopantetheinyl transferase